MAYQTVNRGWLKRQIEAGKMEIKCRYEYTDDYAGDAAANFGKTDWMPARIGSTLNDKAEGVISLQEYSFKGRDGAAYRTDDSSVITLRVYRGLVYEFRAVTA